MFQYSLDAASLPLVPFRVFVSQTGAQKCMAKTMILSVRCVGLQRGVEITREGGGTQAVRGNAKCCLLLFWRGRGAFSLQMAHLPPQLLYFFGTLEDKLLAPCHEYSPCRQSCCFTKMPRMALFNLEACFCWPHDTRPWS